MDKRRFNKNSTVEIQILLFALLIGGVFLLYQEKNNWLHSFMKHRELLFGLFLLFLIILFLVWIFPTISCMYFYLKRSREMKLVEIVLSRDDTTTPEEMMKFFEFVNGALLTEFPLLGFFKGFDHFIWEVSVDNHERSKTIRLAASKYLLDQVSANLQSVYQNIQFIPLNMEVGKQVPVEFLQFRLSRKWYFSLDAATDYQKSIMESFLSTLDGEVGKTTLQVVINPYSLSKQWSLSKKAEKKQSTEYRGGSIFQCEIRMFTDSEQHKKAVIANLAESNAQNRLIPETLLNFWLRKLFRKVWWHHFVEKRMPSLLLGPKVTLNALQLSTLFQLPTMKVRVSGLNRSSSRRVPSPTGIPKNYEHSFLITENNEFVSMPEDMRFQNTLFIGMQGVGKTTALLHYAAPVLRKLDDASIIVSHDRTDIMKFLSYIPPEKKLYIIDLSRPSEYGLNILADDHVPADTLSGNLLSSFRTAYGNDAIRDQSGDFLLESFHALRKVREEHEYWREAIPIIDFRHMRDMIANDDFRQRVIADLPEGSSIHGYWHTQFQKLLDVRSVYLNKVAPILNKYNTLLQSERVEKILCHPNPITLRKVIREEKAVFMLYTAKHEVGEENAKLFANMLMSLIFQAISSQADLSEEKRTQVHLFLDEVQGYANSALLTLLQEARKYGARTAGATLSLSSIPPELQKPFNQLFGNKVIFRNNDLEEATKWSRSFAQLYSDFVSLRDEDQDRVRVGTEDILSLKQFYAVVKMTVDGEPKDAFLAKTIESDHRENPSWRESRTWPHEDPTLKVPVIRVPILTSASENNTNLAGNTTTSKNNRSSKRGKEVYPSIHGISSTSVRKIVTELNISYDQAMVFLGEAAEELERKKARRGVQSLLKGLLIQKMQRVHTPINTSEEVALLEMKLAKISLQHYRNPTPETEKEIQELNEEISSQKNKQTPEQGHS